MVKKKSFAGKIDAHLRKTHKGFVWDIFSIGIFIFVLAIALPIFSVIWSQTSSHVAAQAPNATDAAALTQMGNNMFYNTPDIIIMVLYFGLILAALIAAGYEGANPAVTLMLGIIFLIISEVVAMGISNAAHGYLTQPNMLGIVQHYSLTLWIMDQLPILNGIFTIGYIIFVLLSKEEIRGYVGNMIGGGDDGGGGGGYTVSQ